MLTERQKRERDFYDEYACKHQIKNVDFTPIMSGESRPWNSYWFVYELVRNLYRHHKQKLLDFGCSNGERSVCFAKKGYSVYGFDISSKNIEQAKILAEKYQLHDRIHFSVQVAEKTEYKDAYFDLIVGVDILHHVDIGLAIKECQRILKSDGVAIFREHIEVACLDKVRNSFLFRRLIPKSKSFKPSLHITDDERKLTHDDLKIIQAVFPNLESHRFTLLSRLDKFIRSSTSPKSSLLEQCDYFLKNKIPALANFGGTIVMVLKN